MTLVSWTNVSVIATSPVVYNGVDPDTTTQPIQFTGHADLAQLPDGTWWSTLLGIRPQGGNIKRAPLGASVILPSCGGIPC